MRCQPFGEGDPKSLSTVGQGVLYGSLLWQDHADLHDHGAIVQLLELRRRSISLESLISLDRYG
jgi:hypothetical protein